MLTRLVRWFLIGTLVVVAGTVVDAAPAFADHEYCSPDGQCYWVVDNPGGGGGGGSTGGGGGGGAGQGCTYGGQPVPCVVDGLGVWNGSCYVMRVPPPVGGRPDGFWTVTTCGIYGGGAITVSPATWSADPPAGILPTYAELAQRAVAQMNLKGPQIGVAPTPAGAGLVGLPIWLWTTVTDANGDGPKTWGTIVRTAAVPGRSVTATARSTKIVWNLGDGSAPITCTGPGTAYQPAFGKAAPDCGSVLGYQHPSSTVPGGRYTVTGTTTWEVTWAGTGGGATGNLVFNLTTTTTIDIQEQQVVTS